MWPHDCLIGNNCVFANNATLAGHVTIEDKAVIGGLVAIHQFVHVGTCSIIGGCSKVVQDIPPYSTCDGHPARVYGLNLVGLRRSSMPKETIKELHRAFAILFNTGSSMKNALAKLEGEELHSPEAAYLVDFIRRSERGIAVPAASTSRALLIYNRHSMEKIGLIAGNRKFPLLFASSARARGCRVVAVAIKGDTCAAIKNAADKVYWLGLNEFSRMFDVFKKEEVTKVAMAGQISPRRLFSREVAQDPFLRELLDGLKDARADSIFKEIAARLKSAGFELIDSTTYIAEYLPKKGTLTQRQPNFAEWDDIYFGFDMAKEMGLLDIGQTVAIKRKAVVAVEALEGTDNLIRRAGAIARAGAVIVKVSKPSQDMRFDIPVVGLNTIKTLIRSKASCLAIEAGKTLFIDQKQSVSLADKGGIAIVAI